MDFLPTDAFLTLPISHLKQINRALDNVWNFALLNWFLNYRVSAVVEVLFSLTITAVLNFFITFIRFSLFRLVLHLELLDDCTMLISEIEKIPQLPIYGENHIWSRCISSISWSAVKKIGFLFLPCKYFSTVNRYSLNFSQMQGAFVK